ncbi:MAG TPA: hypothetical protein ENI32_01065 [Candidatus Syntrophoarchaeum butanivorans]|uniref:Uncharacterized protein n=1 Tax=Candidatus Syntropharchaeum butanivorans TaxID=1839936 RepID=A0A7J2RZ03_9EURY|nr:hypothetical protein [Candidatus Syntrophoarchaeum butanivorans]
MKNKIIAGLIATIAVVAVVVVLDVIFADSDGDGWSDFKEKILEHIHTMLIQMLMGFGVRMIQIHQFHLQLHQQKHPYLPLHRNQKQLLRSYPG